MWILFFVGILLSGCTDQIRVVGFAPKADQELIGQQIDELSDKFLIAKDVRSQGKKYYLGQIKYAFNKLKANYKTLDQRVYELTVDKNGKVTHVYLLPTPKKQVRLYATMPNLPDRSSLLSKLFADVGSVAII